MPITLSDAQITYPFVIVGYLDAKISPATLYDFLVHYGIQGASGIVIVDDTAPYTSGSYEESDSSTVSAVYREKVKHFFQSSILFNDVNFPSDESFREFPLKRNDQAYNFITLTSSYSL
jgi:hypothetical protein